MNDRFLDQEEEFHKETTKHFRLERKNAQGRDRSKYKKTDQDQWSKREILSPTMTDTSLRGRVLGIYPEDIQVDVSGTLYRCQLKGVLKKEKNTSKNLVAIGDFVLFEPKDTQEGIIFHVEPRFSVLSRADNLLRRKEQLIAVNIDQVIITVSIQTPSLKPFLIDRYIIAAQKGNMKPLIVINKIDLFSDCSQEEQSLILACQEIYHNLDIPILCVSTITQEGIAQLKEHMKGKSSVFSGQSGTGKSSLINAVTGSSLRTGEVIDKTSKGSHTTTSSRLLPLEEGGVCVDTPGIKSFGLWDLKAEEIEQYFDEIHETACHCKFPGCTHDSEPNCAVKEALELGTISFIRFASYNTLLATLKEKHTNR